jgi:hypothetical protein
MIYNNSIHISQKTHCLSLTKTNLLTRVKFSYEHRPTGVLLEAHTKVQIQNEIFWDVTSWYWFRVIFLI